MGCGNLILQDPTGRFWILNVDVDGSLITSLTTSTFSPFVAPIIASPSYFWQLSAGIDGAVIQTPVLTPGPSSYLLSSTASQGFTLTIDDFGILATTSGLGIVSIKVPYPIDVTMSVFPNLGFTSSVAGATPLTVSADYSIWSCTLNKFINEDTTNIIVVLDE